MTLYRFCSEDCPDYAGGHFHSVSVEEQVAALQEEGVGEVVEARPFGEQGVVIGAVSEPGRYLVVRIEGET